MSEHTLKFPVTLIDEKTKARRVPFPEDVLLTIDCTGNSQTKYPRDLWDHEGNPAMWFADGAIYVLKMRGTGIWYGTYYFLAPNKEYDVHFHYYYDTSYDYWRRFWLNEDGSWYWTTENLLE